MSSLKANFDEVVERVRQGRELTHASYEPIYYLIFHPSEILTVKRLLPAWTARLSNDGWDVHRFSIAQEIAEILEQSPKRKIWLAADRKAPLAWEKTNQALATSIAEGALQSRLEARLTPLKDKTNA